MTTPRSPLLSAIGVATLCTLPACDTRIQEPELATSAFSLAASQPKLSGIPHGWVVSSLPMAEAFVTYYVPHHYPTVWTKVGGWAGPENGYFALHEMTGFDYLRLVEERGILKLYFGFQADATLYFTLWLEPDTKPYEGVRRGVYSFWGSIDIYLPLPDDLGGARQFRDWLEEALYAGLTYLFVWGSPPPLEELLP
jgi:hypothetical protein